MRTYLTAASSLVLAAALVGGPPAWAAASRVWVSGHGVDQAGCGAPTAPCRSLQYAHDNAIAPGGEIDILDPAGYGALHVTKAVSVVNDGVGTAGVQSTSGIAIDIDAGSTDEIYLRGLNIDGVNYAGDTGVQFNTGASLTMVNCVVRHFVHYGISIVPTGTTSINISDSASSDNHGGGMLLRPPSGTADTNMVVNRATIQNNAADGVSIDGGATTGAVTTFLYNSNVSGNTLDGLRIQSANLTTPAAVAGSLFSANAHGLETMTNGRVVMSNSVAVSIADIDVFNGGSFVTFDNNFIGSIGGPNALQHATLH